MIYKVLAIAALAVTLGAAYIVMSEGDAVSAAPSVSHSYQSSDDAALKGLKIP